MLHVINPQCRKNSIPLPILFHYNLAYQTIASICRLCLKRAAAQFSKTKDNNKLFLMRISQMREREKKKKEKSLLLEVPALL